MTQTKRRFISGTEAVGKNDKRDESRFAKYNCDAGTPFPSESELEAMKIADLSRMLKDRQLPSTGLKRHLVERLFPADSGVENTSSASSMNRRAARSAEVAVR